LWIETSERITALTLRVGGDRSPSPAGGALGSLRVFAGVVQRQNISFPS
jgi:hypothetical protein